MFKKFLVGFMAFAMVTVQANAVSNNSLKAAFDELNYSLSVDWDQTDRAFYNAQMEKFTAKVKELQIQSIFLPSKSSFFFDQSMNLNSGL